MLAVKYDYFWYLVLYFGFKRLNCSPDVGFDETPFVGKNFTHNFYIYSCPITLTILSQNPRTYFSFSVVPLLGCYLQYVD